ncbi:MAG: response regulator transcription factor [Chitinispirillia bacterium]|nr:response regulator transcription factor [Chitinispirillia bacterium]MCL2268795.1 response regulator transcription factor [Chitinispirillia bacterium]
MKKKILVIEDDLDIADLVKLVLETDEMFEVDFVLDSEAAYAKVKEYRPDAILLDLNMPKLDGWAVFRQIRGDKSFNGTPIAILTGKSREFDHMVGLHIMNADAYIAKPFGKQELIDKTYELFKRKE